MRALVVSDLRLGEGSREAAACGGGGERGGSLSPARWILINRLAEI